MYLRIISHSKEYCVNFMNKFLDNDLSCFIFYNL